MRVRKSEDLSVDILALCMERPVNVWLGFVENGSIVHAPTTINVWQKPHYVIEHISLDRLSPQSIKEICAHKDFYWYLWAGKLLVVDEITKNFWMGRYNLVEHSHGTQPWDKPALIFGVMDNTGTVWLLNGRMCDEEKFNEVVEMHNAYKKRATAFIPDF